MSWWIGAALKAIVVLLALIGAVGVVGFLLMCFGAAEMDRGEQGAKDYR